MKDNAAISVTECLQPNANDQLPSPLSPLRSNRWLVCMFLFLATTINYVDRQILSLLKPLLDEQLHWSNEQFGWVNSAFQGAYGIGLLGFGWLIDRIGARSGYAFSVGIWSIAAATHALVGSIGGCFLARIFLGLGEGGNFPSAIKSITIWFPQSERAFATSIVNVGTNMGAILAPACVPFIASRWGWQAAFIGAGSVGLLWVWMWIAWHKKFNHAHPEDLALSEPCGINKNATHSSSQEAWRDLLWRRETLSFMIAKCLTDPVWWFFLIWLPDFFKQTRGLDIKSSWLHLVVIYSIVTVLSVLGGWIPGWLSRRGISIARSRRITMIACAVLVTPIYFVTWVSDWSAVMLIGLAGASHQGWSANLFSTVSDSFPPRSVASVVGIGGMAGALGGIIFPIATGKLLDYCTIHSSVTDGYHILFMCCASAYLLALGLQSIVAGRSMTTRESENSN